MANQNGQDKTYIYLLPTQFPYIQGKDNANELIVAFAEFATANELKTTQSGKKVIRLQVYLKGQGALVNQYFPGLQATQDGSYFCEVEFWNYDAEEVEKAAQQARNRKGEASRRVKIRVAGALRVHSWSANDGPRVNLKLENAFLGKVEPVIVNQNNQGNNQTTAPNNAYNPNSGNNAPNGWSNPNGGNNAPNGWSNPNGGNNAPNGWSNPNGGNNAPQAPAATGDFALMEDDDGELPF